MPHDFGTECIYERVWVYPLILDFGFIVADTSGTFEIWNAYQHRTIEVTSVTLSGEATGISIDTPATPFDLSPLALKTLTVSITLDGPQSQDSSYAVLADGVTSDVDVLGTRTIAIEPEPDWRRSPSIRYEFATVLFQNPYFLEQRRPLSPIPWRLLEVDYVVSGLEAQRLMNAAAYGHDKAWVVPLYHERMTPTAATAGTTTIAVEETTSGLWNLANLATHVALIDHGARQVEVKMIDSLGASAIEVTSDIVATFDLDSTTVYPVFFGYLHGVSVAPETDEDVVVRMRFREYKDG